jgi:hypothetical protein
MHSGANTPIQRLTISSRTSKYSIVWLCVEPKKLHKMLLMHESSLAEISAVQMLMELFSIPSVDGLTFSAKMTQSQRDGRSYSTPDLTSHYDLPRCAQHSGMTLFHDSLQYWCLQYRKFPGFFISQPATNSTTTNTLNSHQVNIIFTLLFLCDGAHIVASIPTD